MALVALCFSAFSLAAEEPRPAREPALLTHTGEGLPESPSASLDDFGWLIGHWQGEGLGGLNEEAWSGPASGQMMGMYRMIGDGQVRFMELLTLTEEKGSVQLRLKHFNRDLSGWEDKGDTVDFRLLKLEPGAAWFDGGSMFRIDEERMEVWVRIGGKGEQPERAVRIDYRKVGAVGSFKP
jgi:hypothetical protein